jgi:zinc transport system substrate-binding protein
VIARIVLIIWVALLTAGCGGGGGAGDGDGVEVVAAFYPLAYAAERVSGGEVDVRNLTPPGAEPHDVELTARDVERVRRADVVLYLGGGFQPALEDAVAEAEGNAVDLLDGLRVLGDEVDDGHAEEHGDGSDPAVDPHVWLDPLRYATIVRRIGRALESPEAVGAMVGELRQLDRDFRRGLADCDRRELVTSHSAFAYLARRYDLRQISLTGLSPESEPTPRELEEIIEHVEESGARTIFFETLVSPRIAETVARETDAQTAVLNPLEGLTEEELESGANYFTVMRRNLDALRTALGCR